MCNPRGPLKLSGNFVPMVIMMVSDYPQPKNDKYDQHHLGTAIIFSLHSYALLLFSFRLMILLWPYKFFLLHYCENRFFGDT